MAKKISGWKTKGMNRDLSVSAFNPEFAFENMNLRLSTNEGNTTFSWVNEKGTASIPTWRYYWKKGNDKVYINPSDSSYTKGEESFFIYGTCIGTAVLNEYLVLFITDDNVNNDKDHIYRLVYNGDKTRMYATELYAGNLGFDASHPLETLVSYESNAIQKVYWTDGINQPRLINIAPDNDSKIGKYTSTSFDFITTLKLNETIKVQKILGGGGMFAPGVIQYAFTYYNKYGQESNIFYTTPLYYISYQDRGGSPEDKVDNTFKITFDGIEIGFDYLRIYSIQRTSINATPFCKRVQDIEIASMDNGSEIGEVQYKKASYIDTGMNGDTIDPTELLYKGGNVINVGTMEQKDNTLFMGDITIPRNIIPNISSTEGISLETGSREFVPTLVSKDNYEYASQLTSYKAEHIIEKDENNEDVDVVVASDESVPCAGFKYGDKYRCGVQFQDETGKWSDPILLKDVDIDGSNRPSVTTTLEPESVNDLNILVTLKNHSENSITFSSTVYFAIDDGYGNIIKLTVILGDFVYDTLTRNEERPYTATIKYGKKYLGKRFCESDKWYKVDMKSNCALEDTNGSTVSYGMDTVVSGGHPEETYPKLDEDNYILTCGESSPEPPSPTDPLYKVGLFSDIHMDTDDEHNSEYAEDLRNALEYFNDNNVDFVAACGDFIEYKDDDFNDSTNGFSTVYNEKKGSLNLYTCLGNHDYFRIYGQWSLSHYQQYSTIAEKEQYLWDGCVATFHGSESSLHFFNNGATRKDKQNYWFSKSGDIFVFISIDYGTSTGSPWDDVIRGRYLLDSNDTNVQEMADYVSDTNYDAASEALYNYQFYNPAVLMWLKDILEENEDKRIFVFSHHYLPHKAGDTDAKYSYITANDGSSALCGLTFWFINKLNNKFKNVVWFSGHSHRIWTNGISICNQDYEFYTPQEVEDMQGEDKPMPYTRKNSIVTSGSGAWVGLPGLAKPYNGTSLLYQASQGGILEVYSDRVELKEISFKVNGASTYENRVLKTVTLAAGADTIPEYEDIPELGDAIEIRLYNTLDVPVWFSGRLKFNVTPDDPSDWSSGNIVDTFYWYLCPPDNYIYAEGNYWVQWHENGFLINPGEYLSAIKTRIIDYRYDTNIGEMVEFTSAELSAFAARKGTTPNYRFMATDNIVGGALYSPSVKLGCAIRDTSSGLPDNIPFCVHVQPLSRGEACNIVYGRRYNLKIDDFQTSGEDWEIIPYQETVESRSLSKGTSDTKSASRAEEPSSGDSNTSVKTMSVTVPVIKGTIPSSIAESLIEQGYVKARAVVVYPNEQDRKIICQGVACPTLFTDNHREKYFSDAMGDLYAQSSWFFRPQSSNSEEYNQDVNAPSFLHNNPLVYVSNTLDYNPKQIKKAEIQGHFDDRNKFTVDWRTLTFHSPDIEFDTNLANLDYTSDNLQYKCIGYSQFMRTFSDIDIQTNTPAISSLGSGFLKRSFVKGGANGIISGLFWDDYEVDENTRDGETVFEAHTKEQATAKWMVYLWNKTGSLTNDIERPADKGVMSSELKRKIVSNLRFANTVWKEQSNVPSYETHLFYTDQPEILKLRTPFSDTANVYMGNIDTLLMPDEPDGTYFSIAVGVRDLTPNAPGSMDHIYSYSFASTSFNSTISWKTFGIKDNTEFTKKGNYQYKNGLWDRDENSPFSNTVGNTYSDLVIKKSQVRMKYKSTPHLVLVQGNSGSTLIPSDSNYYPALSILELQRTFSEDYPFFGGDSDDAKRALAWIPCGEPVRLDNTDDRGNVHFEYSWGDTYYQRWDCLKTYAFTPEDVNQVVEIGSFMLETRVNIDGRYDRNRGQLSNLYMSPRNFNLINPVYSQLNNFFTYRIQDDDAYKEKKYPNQITWSKTKTSGADVDLWTNVTLASVLEMDGDKGKVRKLIRLNDQLICFQDKGISQVMYNENVQINSTDGVPIEIANSGKVQGKRYFTDSVGCSNKWSMVQTPSGIYFMDSLNKAIFLFNGQLNNLSGSLGFNTWSKKNIPSAEVEWTPLHYIPDAETPQKLIGAGFDSFVAYYDKLNQDVLFINNETALAFSERMGVFTSFYDYGESPYLDNLYDTGVWIRNDLEKQGDRAVSYKPKISLWKHQAGEYCEFFTQHKPYWMTLVGNPEPQTDKIFTNLEFRACVDGDGVEETKTVTDSDTEEETTVKTGKFIPDLPFTSLETWDEYQHGITTLNNRNGHDAFKHHTADSQSSLKRKFRIWRCDIPRDNYLVDPDTGSEIDPEKGIARYSKHPNDRMRNPWLYLKLMKKAQATMARAEIHDIVMTYYN